jgi:hypothetical protein
MGNGGVAFEGHAIAAVFGTHAGVYVSRLNMVAAVVSRVTTPTAANVSAISTVVPAINCGRKCCGGKESVGLHRAGGVIP